MKLNRRAFTKTAVGVGLSSLFLPDIKAFEPEQFISLFDGKTLNGWIQIEYDAVSLSPGQFKNAASLLSKVAAGADPVSRYFASRLSDGTRAALPSYTPGTPQGKSLLSAVIKDWNAAIDGPAFEMQAFQGVVLRPETRSLLETHPQGQRLARLNKMLLEDAFPTDLTKSAETGWVVKDGVMASTGSGRGVIYTAQDFTRFRLIFTVRHISGSPNHEAGVLVFGTRPEEGQKPLYALGGIQFRVPEGSHWDYRPGKSNEGGDEFSAVKQTGFNPHEWSQIEILADASTGKARMAVAQPPGSKAVEIVSFSDRTAGRTGPIALQMHNEGLFDEYKDLKISVDPREDRLLTVS